MEEKNNNWLSHTHLKINLKIFIIFKYFIMTYCKTKIDFENDYFMCFFDE